jgi:cytoskeletal protein CcmA (bactofilin family)
VLALKCAVCGVRKGEANRWWVLFQADSHRATLICPMEEAETLQQWREQATRFHLCGAGCLYRKLSGILVPGVDRPKTETHLAQPSSPHNAAPVPASNANPPVARCGSEPEDGFWLRRATQDTLRRIVGIHNHLERIASDSAESSLNPTTGMNKRVPSTRLRETPSVSDSLRITGRLLSREPLYICGEVVGTLELPDARLTVGPNGNIRAVVSAKEVEIFGVIEGEVKADKVIVRKNATLIGDVYTRALTIEGGAWFEGRSAMGSRKMINSAKGTSNVQTVQAS